MKTLTVLTYLHPEEKLLQRCINGLKQQSAKFEWIVLGYKDPFIKHIPYTFWQLDKHVSSKAHALNIILPQINTTYIAYNDADDTSLPGRFNKQINFLEKHEKVDILGGNLMVNGEKSGWPFYEKDEKIKHFLILNNPIVNSSVMLRNTAIKWGINIKYDKNHQRAEDYAFWWKAAKSNLTFANLNEELIDYYQHKNKAFDAEKIIARTIREEIIQHFCTSQFSQEEINKIHLFAEKGFTSKKNHDEVKKLLITNLPNSFHKIINNHQLNYSFWRTKIKGLKIF